MLLTIKSTSSLLIFTRDNSFSFCNFSMASCCLRSLTTFIACRMKDYCYWEYCVMVAYMPWNLHCAISSSLPISLSLSLCLPLISIPPSRALFNLSLSFRIFVSLCTCLSVSLAVSLVEQSENNFYRALLV